MVFNLDQLPIFKAAKIAVSGIVRATSCACETPSWYVNFIFPCFELVFLYYTAAKAKSQLFSFYSVISIEPCQTASSYVLVEIKVSINKLIYYVTYPLIIVIEPQEEILLLR